MVQENYGRLDAHERQEYFVPDIILVRGPAALRGDKEVYRAYLSRTGEWRGPFDSLAKAEDAFEHYKPEDND